MKETVPHRWWIFGILAAQYLVVYFQRVSPAVVAGQLAGTFGISAVSLGLLSSAYFYTYAVMQIPVGVLVDTWGPKKTILVFGLIASFGAIAFGCSPNYVWAIISRGIIGFGLSAIFIAIMKTLMRLFHATELARASGVLIAVGGAGWFLATAPLAFSSQVFGWRTSVSAIGVISAVLIFITWLSVKDPFSSYEKDKRPSDLIPDLRNTMQGMKVILRNRSFWSIGVWFVMRGGVLFGFFGLWAGPYLRTVHGLSATQTGNVLSMIALAMIIMSPIVGHLSDRIGSRRKVLIWTSVLDVACWLVMVAFFERLSPGALMMFFFLIGVTTSSIGAIAIIMATEPFPHALAGTSMGATNLFPFVGAIVFQPLMGYVLDRGGGINGVYTTDSYRVLLWMLLLLSLIALFSITQSKDRSGSK